MPNKALTESSQSFLLAVEMDPIALNAGCDAAPGILIPMASMHDAIELAVYIPPQAPAPIVLYCYACTANMAYQGKHCILRCVIPVYQLVQLSTRQ